MILNYTASLGTDGLSEIRSYSQRLLSPIYSPSKLPSALNYFTADVSEKEKTNSIKKELALRIVQGKIPSNSRTNFGFFSPLGPGHYNYTVSSLNSPSVKFPSFSRGSTENFTKRSFKTSDIVSSNKNLQQYTPEVKNKEAKLKIKEKKERILHVQNSKKEIVQEKKKKMLEKIDEKNKKILKIKQKEFFSQIEITWMILFVTCGVSSNTQAKLAKLKNLRLIVKRKLQVFCISARFIGFIIAKSWSFRSAKAKKTLLKLVGIVKVWIKNRRAKYRYIMHHLLETFSNKDRITKLMYKWRTAIILIQRSFRQILLENKITASIRLLSWNLAETKIPSNRKLKALTKFQTLASAKRPLRVSLKERSQTLGSIPSEVKSYFIKSFFRVKVRDFIEALNLYKIKCRIEIDNYKRNWYLREAAAARGEFNRFDLVLPEKPKPEYNLNEFEMRKLVNAALDKIEMWDRIIKETNLEKIRGFR